MDEDVGYTLTPKGLACLALYDAGLIFDVMDERVDKFWDRFIQSLVDRNYLEYVDESEGEVI